MFSPILRNIIFWKICYNLIRTTKKNHHVPGIFSNGKKTPSINRKSTFRIEMFFSGAVVDESVQSVPQRPSTLNICNACYYYTRTPARINTIGCYSKVKQKLNSRGTRWPVHPQTLIVNKLGYPWKIRFDVEVTIAILACTTSLGRFSAIGWAPSIVHWTSNPRRTCDFL